MTSTVLQVNVHRPRKALIQQWFGFSGATGGTHGMQQQRGMCRHGAGGAEGRTETLPQEQSLAFTMPESQENYTNMMCGNFLHGLN